MKLDNLKKLYAHQLKDLWSAENQMVDSLPAVIESIEDEELAGAVKSHLEQTKTHVTRLDSIFRQLDYGPHGHKCKGMEGLLAETRELLDADAEQPVRDAGIIAALQRIEHYEMAGYGTARAYAEKLGLQDQVDILVETLEQEGMANRDLTRLAERSINFEAMMAGD